MFERIVVGYAGDRAGRDGVVLASQLASMCGAELTIVFPYHPLLSTVPSDVAELRARGEVSALLGDRAPEKMKWHWSNASWPIHALHEIAEYEQAQAIVFGAAPERLERRHLNLMERMVHGAPCAVVVAPAGYADRQHEEIRRVGVGFVDTPEGRHALELGCELSHRPGVAVRALAGASLSPALLGYASMSPLIPSVQQEIHDETDAALSRATGDIDGDSRMRLEVRSGDPSHLLVNASSELDLLILGSRAYGPLRHALLGSVSAEVMRDSHCPVLVLPRQTTILASPRGSRAVLAEH
jgi:nucleotide-binding universal stress UspA family protein